MQSRDVSSDRAAPAHAATRTATPVELAWLGAVVVALALVLALLLIGPPLGRLFFTPRPADFWPFWTERTGVLPEPSERVAYLLALLAPVSLAAIVALGARRAVELPSALLRIGVPLAQALVPGVLVVAIVAQHRKVFGLPYSDLPLHHVYFTLPTLVVAALVALAVAAGLQSARVVALAGRWTRETRARRLVALLLAALFAALWLLTAINTEASIANGHFRIFVNLPFWLDEPYAVLNGRVPLVDFTPAYGHLLAFPTAAAMALFGTSLGAYTTIMATGTGLGMLALFATLRRVVHRSLLALALFVPTLSTSFFTELGPPEARHGPQTLFSVFPLRYLGAFVLAWLTARHLDGAAPRRRWLLFAIGGLVAINNLEFGLAALGATFAALALLLPSPTWARAGRLVLDAAAGVLAAAAAVAVLTLALAGSLPDFGILLTFPRIFGVSSLAMMPMPHLGFHVAIYVTFAGAIVLAVVRAVSRSEEPLLTGMLAWAGVFGLGAASYYAGRSLPEVLISIFSAWSFALALLLVATVRAVLARPARRPTLAELGVLLAFGIAVCSVAQTPTPWSQVERLQERSPERPAAGLPARPAIAAATRPGEHVLILNPYGHRIAYDLGLDNVSPYGLLEEMPVREQLAEAIDALREAGGRKLFLPISQTHPEHLEELQRAGFAVVKTDEQRDVIELVDGGA